MKLYMHPVSQTSRPIRLLIAEKGLSVDEEVVDLMTGAHHQEPFASMNPSRQVPVLVDDDLQLTECSAILKYLADKYDMPEYPKDLKQRAKVNEIMDWFNTGFYRDWAYNLCYPQIFPHQKRPTDEGQRVALEWGKEKTQFWLQVLNDHWLGDGRAYLAGNQITIADYLGAGYIALGEILRFDFSPYPNVVAWLNRVKTLPNWAPVSEVIDGFADSVKEQPFTV
ncbi:MAG: glutathione S-transferase family protein [Saccharospirillum sp.]